MENLDSPWNPEALCFPKNRALSLVQKTHAYGKLLQESGVREYTSIANF